MFLIAVVLAFVSLSTNSVNAKEINNVFEKKVYTHEQISDDKIIEMAKNGEFVNNETVTTNFYDGEVSIIEVKKVLSEDFVSGEIVKKEMMSLQEIEIDQNLVEEIDGDELNDLINNTISDNNVLNITPFASSEGDKGVTTEDDALTVKISVRMYYDSYTNANKVEHCRIKSVTYTPTLNDTRFGLTSISSHIRYEGAGYTLSNGTYSPVVRKVEETSYSNSSLTSGKVYTKTTGFTLFVISTDYTGGGVNTTLNYKRTLDGKTFSLSTPPLKF